MRYRRPTAHSSCCSGSTAPTRRRTAGRLGKIPTTSVRRRISLFRRSWGLLEPHLLPVSHREGGEGQGVRSSLGQYRGGLGEPVSELIDHPVDLGVHLLGGRLLVDGAYHGGHPRLGPPGHPCKPESTEGGRRVSVLKRQEGAPVLLG